MAKRVALIWSLVAEAAKDLSFSDLGSLLSASLLNQFGRDADGCQRFYIQDIFPDYVIARGDDGKIFRVSYVVDDSNNVTLSDAQEVETAYVPVSESGTFLAASESDAGSVDDCVYPVQVMKAGWGGGTVDGGSLPHYYPPEFIKIISEAVNRAKFGRQHPDQNGDDPFGHSDPERIAGYFSDGRINGVAAEATLNLLKSETGLRSKLAAAREAKRLDMFGLSILALIGWRPGVIEGKKCLVAEALAKLYSVDLCSEAGAGGAFLELKRVAASAGAFRDIAAQQDGAVKQGSSVQRGSGNGGQQKHREGNTMNKAQILRVIEALRTSDPARAKQLQEKLDAAEEAGYGIIMAEASEALSSQNIARSEAILLENKKLSFKSALESKLATSKLPEPAKKLVRTQMSDATDETLIDLQITSVREAFAAMHPSGRVNGTAAIVLGSEDKMQLAMDRMMGVKTTDTSVPAFKGVREAYQIITGDTDLRALTSGGFYARAQEAMLTTSFPNLLLDSANKRLLQDFKELGMGGLDMLFTKSDIADFKLQQRVRDGYFAELPVVAEGAPYVEMAYPTDERVSYQVVKRGGLLTISEETIRNDDLGAIVRFPNRMARAGHRTLKNFITGFFINNPNYAADGVTWFNAVHNNLGASPLSQDALVAAEIVLGKQTEKDSGERLGLTLDWIMVPLDLKATAIQINQTNTAGSNAFYQRFGANNERIIVNEMLLDANDWYFGTDQSNAPFLEVGFLDGIMEPQIFIANLPTQGASFTNDEIQYKVKHVFGGTTIDYRGVGKQVN